MSRRLTHTRRRVGLLPVVTAGVGAAQPTLVLLLSLLQVAHQGLADNVLQAQVTGWVTEGVIPGVHVA